MIGTTTAAEILNVSTRRIRVLCEQGRIPGAELVGKTWTLPDDPKVIAAVRERPGVIEMKAKPKKRKGKK